MADPRHNGNITRSRIPGAIYSVWRLSTRYEGCPSCLQPGMIPADSPLAVRALNALKYGR
jgi:hypothetical protein